MSNAFWNMNPGRQMLAPPGFAAVHQAIFPASTPNTLAAVTLLPWQAYKT
jgi:hypothetical protein